MILLGPLVGECWPPGGEILQPTLEDDAASRISEKNLKPSPFIYKYTLHDLELSGTDVELDLGITISSDLKWLPKKSNMMLSLLK